MVEGGTAHGYKIKRSIVVSLGCPLPPYIKEQGGRCGRPGGGAPGGVLLPPGVGLPPFLVEVGEGGGGGREEGKGGAAPLSLSYSDYRGGACGPALAASPLLH